MTEHTNSNNTILEVFNSISQQCITVIDGAMLRATQSVAIDLYKLLAEADDWLKADFSLAINLLESNSEWLAAQVSTGVSDKLQKNFHEKLKPNVTKAAKKPLKRTSLKLGSLSLVSKDDYEDWLTANVGIKFLEGELSYELHEAVLVLSYLTGKSLDEKNCGVGPTDIFTLLKQSIDELEIPSSPQAIIYKTISRSLQEDLKKFYLDIVRSAQKVGLDYESLESAEIIENTEVPVSKEPVASAHSLNSPSSSSVSDTAPDAFGYDEALGVSGANTSNAHNGNELTFSGSHSVGSELVDAGDAAFNGRQSQMNTLNTLSRLNTAVSSGGSLKSSSEVSSIPGGADTSISTSSLAYNPTQLVSAISQLQQIHGDQESEERKNLRAWIESGLTDVAGESCSIGDQESELIDVTDRFFEVIVEKVGVSGLLKRWLEKLKLTILKVVLRDKNFFSDVSHPARQMLNKLAKLVANDKTEQKRLEKVLDRVIDKVVSEYDDDEQVVEKILDELNHLLDRQALAYQRNSDRIARAYDGKQKVADARSKVVADINNLLAGKSVPVVLLELLDKAGWREHLSFVAVRDDHSSEAYKEVLNVVDLLLNWLGEETDSADKWAIELEMELEAPSLLELITKELSIVGLVGYEAILKRMEDCLFNNADPLLVKVEEYEWPYDKTEKDIDDLRPGQRSGMHASHWHKRIVSMKVGDWVEIKDDSGRTRCLRLAWSGSESFRFVFVDSQGMKDEDVSLDDLVVMFKDNRASFVDHEDVPLVDQGLHQMVQSVYEELAGQSSCDVLTGLLNRQAFERALEQSIAGAVTNQSATALLYIDLDKFSLTNTSYGHHAGDALLKHVAKALKNQGMEDAFCGRLGGNEFGMILNGCTVDAVSGISKKICKDVESTPYSWEDHTISSTVSIGVAFFELETDSFDTVMRKAGLACDSAKTSGRNRVVVYQEQDEDQKKRDEMLQWVQKLDGDLDELLTLRCQEIRPVKIEADSRPHYEVLLGVRQNGQVLPPSMLIEAAEHFDRMAKVDRWVIHNVLTWMEAHESAVNKSNGFSINLSGNSLSDDSFLEFILGQLAASSVLPELICFEITETAAITNLADATEFIRVLKQTGCKFSLDDFGSGLSSYAYIQKLPVDFIKIDVIFIKNIVNNEQDKALVKSINELAHFMGMKTVAEYVESHDILAVLKDIGVDHSQGFGIKKPGLLNDLVA